MNVASLFSGIGGFDLAFERAGAHIILQSEIEPHAQQVLRTHFPNTELIDDVRNIGRVTADVVCGGFPCQDVSVAGKRAGLAGERSGLFFEFARILDESQPTWCLIENVPGLLSSNRGEDMGAVLGTLAQLGYGIAYRVLDAQYFGVPQRRRRVFIVGCLGDARRAGEILLEPKGGCWHPPTFNTSQQNDPEAARGSTPQECWAPDVARPLLSNAKGGQRTSDLDGVTYVTAYRKKRRPTANDDDPETWEEATYTNTLDAGGNVTRTGHAIAYSITPESGQGAHLRAAEVRTSTACTAGDSHIRDRGIKVVDEQLGVRRLMPIECERLQGFPDGWTDGHPDTHRYRMLGNAVAVPVVEWIARRMVNA